MKGQQIKRNSFFAFLSSFVRLLSTFLLFVGIARLYGPFSFGLFTTAHTLSTLFLLFADFGFDILVATEIARRRAEAPMLARRYLSLKLCFIVGATAVMFLTGTFQNIQEDLRILIYIFSLSVFFSSINNFFFAVFRGIEEFHHEARITTVTNVVLLPLIVLFGWTHVPLAVFAFVFVGTRILGVVQSLLVFHRYYKLQSLSFSFRAWKEEWRLVVTFGLFTVAGNLLFQLDTVLLGFWKGVGEVGIYQAAMKIVLLVLVLSDIAVTAFLPSLSRFHRESPERWQRAAYLLFKTLFLGALPVTMVLFVFADQILDFVYGKGTFPESVTILRIFSINVFFRYLFETFALMLTTSQRQWMRTAIVVAAALFNAAANLYAIPTYGPMGAAVVSLMTTLLVGFGYFLGTRRYFGHWLSERTTLIPFVATAAIAIALWQVQTASLWFVGLPAAGLTIAICYFFGYAPTERKELFSWF